MAQVVIINLHEIEISICWYVKDVLDYFDTHFNALMENKNKKILLCELITAHATSQVVQPVRSMAGGHTGVNFNSSNFVLCM